MFIPYAWRIWALWRLVLCVMPSPFALTGLTGFVPPGLRPAESLLGPVVLRSLPRAAPTEAGPRPGTNQPSVPPPLLLQGLLACVSVSGGALPPSAGRRRPSGSVAALAGCDLPAAWAAAASWVGGSGAASAAVLVGRHSGLRNQELSELLSSG